MAPLAHYLDTSATTPPAAAVLAAMEEAQRHAWANPSSLHGFGLAAAEALERSRTELAEGLGCAPERLVFCSGGSEAIHLALLGLAGHGPPGRLLVSAVEHPATLAAAAELVRRGWQLEQVPVDGTGRLDLEVFERLLAPPTRLASVIWGQNEVGTLQPIEAIGALCRRAGVPLHVDAVQVVGHLPLRFDALPIDLLSCAAHKLEGPRGIGALLLRPGLTPAPLIGGGGQEGGRRGGTEPVALAVGFARALALAEGRLGDGGGAEPLAAGREPLAAGRDLLLKRLLALPGVRLSGADPRRGEARLPHHLSLLVRDPAGRPLPGRRLVHALWREGWAVGSGSACSGARGGGASPVLRALGHGEEEAASGLRISLGSWHRGAALEAVLEELPAALERARRGVAAALASAGSVAG